MTTGTISLDITIETDNLTALRNAIDQLLKGLPEIKDVEEVDSILEDDDDSDE